MFQIPGMNMKVNMITYLQWIFLQWIGFLSSLCLSVCVHMKARCLSGARTNGKILLLQSSNPFYWTILLLTPNLQPLSSVFTHNRTHTDTVFWDEQDGLIRECSIDKE